MRHGSLQYWPRKRAQRSLPRVRSVPEAKETALTNMVAYKVATTHVGLIDDSDAPSKGQEVSRVCTILEVPKIEVYGVRLYSKDQTNGYKITAKEFYNKSSADRLKIKKVKHDESKFNDAIKEHVHYTDASALLVAYPKETGISQHHPDRFEANISGSSVEEKMKFLSSILGKEVKASEIFKNGEYVDVMSVTKGKGWQGAIRRFGAKRQNHKATQKIRHVGPLGAFSPAYVMYTIPHPGQMGFHFRTEHNKRILKISNEPINPKAGFKNYGLVKNDYFMIEGSIPGASKRLVRIRRSINNRNKKGIKEPKLTYIAATAA